MARVPSAAVVPAARVPEPTATLPVTVPRAAQHRPAVQGDIALDDAAVGAIEDQGAAVHLDPGAGFQRAGDGDVTRHGELGLVEINRPRHRQVLPVLQPEIAADSAGEAVQGGDLVDGRVQGHVVSRVARQRGGRDRAALRDPAGGDRVQGAGDGALAEVQRPAAGNRRQVPGGQRAQGQRTGVRDLGRRAGQAHRAGEGVAHVVQRDVMGPGVEAGRARHRERAALADVSGAGRNGEPAAAEGQRLRAEGPGVHRQGRSRPCLPRPPPQTSPRRSRRSPSGSPPRPRRWTKSRRYWSWSG